MNLIPIDAGGTPTELVGADASPGGDFAALMTGLMTGDTQIVPLIDIPTGEQLPEGADVAPRDQPADVATSMFEFIGSQPTGLTISPSRQVSPQAMPGTPGDSQAPIEGVQTPQVPVADSLIAGPEPDTSTDSEDGQALATVHPIRTRAAITPSATPETDTTSSTAALTALVGNGPTGQQYDASQPVSTEPEVAVAATDRPAAHARAEAHGAIPLPSAETPVTAAAATATATATATVTATHAAESGTPQSTPDQAGADAQPVEPDVDADIATTSRPLDTVRSGSSITQPAMLGIARRVEEAIAALATKPDPKIVTLQLDELDGLRLTVALRPDGIHLSSTGDATLTTEIERALASRGFDMAAGSDRGRQGSEQNTDDGWRPQPATPGRQARPNQSGIRL